MDNIPKARYNNYPPCKYGEKPHEFSTTTGQHYCVHRHETAWLYVKCQGCGQVQEDTFPLKCASCHVVLNCRQCKEERDLVDTVLVVSGHVICGKEECYKAAELSTVFLPFGLPIYGGLGNNGILLKYER